MPSSTSYLADSAKIMRKIHKGSLLGSIYSALFLAKVYAEDLQGGIESGANAAKGKGTVTNLEVQIRNITNTLLLIVGIAAVIMLIIGGLMYIFSGGDPNNTKRAKDVILYTIIGIAVALLSYAIVTFVLGSFK